MRVARRNPTQPTPICRCRVLYLGSSVPQVTKDGLQGIQEPLKELYPAEGAVNARGIDSWLSVWSNGVLLENVDEKQKKFTRFFPIESLHYCAAVRYVIVGGNGESSVPRFLPLDSPFARNPSIHHPPLFACIMRRTSGIKVLECHAFICKRETPANALVRCCFHAYADSMHAKRLEGHSGAKQTEEREIEVDYTAADCSSTNSDVPGPSGESPGPVNGDENHKVWMAQAPSEVVYSDGDFGTLRSQSSSLYGGTSRANRPRQMIMPSVAPPVSEKGEDRPKSAMNGHLSNGHSPPAKSKSRLPRMFSSLAERKSKTPQRPQPPFLPPPKRMPPQMVPLPPPYFAPPMMVPPPYFVYGPKRPSSRALEEPIYMPSARPMSPTASYQPGHFPHERYLMYQYATAPKKPHKKKKRRKDDEDIYGKKGHINERAFSYSIREEQRSRSYGSLTGLGESKKDREIMQMVANLDLSGDELERVEPRPGVYQPSPHASTSGTITSRLSRSSRR